MRREAHRRYDRGTDVVIGFVETHGRRRTADLIDDLEVVPRKTMTYRGTTFTQRNHHLGSPSGWTHWCQQLVARWLGTAGGAAGQRNRHDGQQRTEVDVRPSTRSKIVLRLMTAGALMPLLVGCLGVSTDSGNPTDQVSQGEMADDEQAAVDATDTYWRRHFSELFGGRTYRSPVVAGGYVGNDGPRCGGQPPVPFNAFYCSDGDFLAWDEELMATGYERIGDAWVYLIIAHEWGHAIQARLDRRLVAVEAELQADCLAGASLRGAQQDGLLQIEPGDAEELGRTLTAVADDFPWTSESDHGNAEQRIAAFNQGTEGGATACIS